jgi:hypothetical protein
MMDLQARQQQVQQFSALAGLVSVADKRTISSAGDSPTGTSV